MITAKQQGGDIVATAQGRIKQAAPIAAAAAAKRAVAPSLAQMITTAERTNRRQADRFFTDLVGRRAASPPPH